MLLLERHPRDTMPQVVYKRSVSLIVPLRPGAEPAANAASLESSDQAASPDFVPLYIPRTRKRR
jgi:host factor-I protein